MARVIEEEPVEKVVVHERDRDVPVRDRGSNVGWIIALVIIVILLLLIFGRGIFGGGSSGGSTDVNITPPTTQTGQ